MNASSGFKAMRNSISKEFTLDKIAVMKSKYKTHHKVSNIFSTLSRYNEKIHKTIHRSLLILSSHAARNPKLYIVAIPLLSFLMFAIGFATNFNLELDEYAAFSPFSSRVKKHREWISDPNTGWPTRRRKIVLAVHSDGNNVLRKNDLRYVFDAIDAVKQTPGYDELCALGDDHFPIDPITAKKTCSISSITRLWEHNLTLYDEAVNSDEDLVESFSDLKYPDGTLVDLTTILGTEDITDVKALISFISLPTTDKTRAFEKDALDRLFEIQRHLDENSNIKLEFLAQRSNGDEFQRSIYNDLPLIPVAIFLMFGFTCLVFFRKNPVESRAYLGVGSVITITLSIMCGHGLMFIFGVPFTNMSMVLPFIIIGVGLDDTFIITAEYFRTSKSKSPEERIHDTISSVGISIFVTTCTTSLAFILGVPSQVPCIRWLCIYAFPMIIIDFIYQITFFVAILVLDEKRIQEKRKDIFHFCSTKSDTVTSKDDENQQIKEHTLALATEKSSFDRLMTWYSEHLLVPWVKLSVVVIFTILFMCCAYSATLLTQEFKTTDLVPDDSYVLRFAETYQKYSNQQFKPDIYFRDVDQSDPIVQEQMIDYIDGIVSLEGFDSEAPFCWVRDFKKLQNDAEYGPILEGLSFKDQIDWLMSIPEVKEAYGKDILRDEDGNIIASRCEVFGKADLDNIDTLITLLHNQREMSAMQSVNQGKKEWAFFSYTSFYLLFEFYAIYIPELIQTTISAVFSVVVISIIFMPHWSGFLFILPLIAILYIDLLGIIQLAGLHMNAVTYIALVVSIGLLVDFIMHILMRFYESNANTREEKVKDALQTMGSSILIGGISTFLGVLPLAWSTSLVVQNIYICFTAMILLGLSHGIILLPVLLSYFGPSSFQYHIHQQHSQDDMEMYVDFQPLNPKFTNNTPSNNIQTDLSYLIESGIQKDHNVNFSDSLTRPSENKNILIRVGSHDDSSGDASTSIADTHESLDSDLEQAQMKEIVHPLNSTAPEITEFVYVQTVDSQVTHESHNDIGSHQQSMNNMEMKCTHEKNEGNKDEKVANNDRLMSLTSNVSKEMPEILGGTIDCEYRDGMSSRTEARHEQNMHMLSNTEVVNKHDAYILPDTEKSKEQDTHMLSTTEKSNEQDEQLLSTIGLSSGEDVNVMSNTEKRNEQVVNRCDTSNHEAPLNKSQSSKGAVCESSHLTMCVDEIDSNLANDNVTLSQSVKRDDQDEESEAFQSDNDDPSSEELQKTTDTVDDISCKIVHLAVRVNEIDTNLANENVNLSQSVKRDYQDEKLETIQSDNKDPSTEALQQTTDTVDDITCKVARVEDAISDEEQEVREYVDNIPAKNIDEEGCENMAIQGKLPSSETIVQMLSTSTNDSPSAIIQEINDAEDGIPVNREEKGEADGIVKQKQAESKKDVTNALDTHTDNTASDTEEENRFTRNIHVACIEGGEKCDSKKQKQMESCKEIFYMPNINVHDEVIEAKNQSDFVDGESCGFTAVDDPNNSEKRTQNGDIDHQ